MMTFVATFKKRYESIIADRGGSAAPHGAGRGWQALLVGFGLIEVIFLALVLFVSYRLEQRQPATTFPIEAQGGASPTIDREQLQDLLDQFERKNATHEELLLAAPSRVDPSVASWYREGDETPEP